jgi:Na+/H+-dicarboxylate symporter
VIFIIWLIFAVLVGAYASSKGRSGVGFFLIAVLLSPLIGFIIAAIVQPIRANTEAKALETGDVRKCPNCAELVKAEARLCKHCHSELA